MPQAYHLQDRGKGPVPPPIPPAQHETQLDLQTPSSTLRQHVDPEALPRPDYFESLDDLHLWYQMQYGDTLQDNLELCSNHTGPPTASSFRPSASTQSHPKLVVCHDFQGGYNEDPHQQGYSLEHLHLVDTFIYFSHKRVSIPPVGWLSAAARTGTKVLGTLIFEWAESVPDMARLLRGSERKAMPLRGEPCFSPQYAIELIELALERGFSGYLVNIEVGLDLGFSCSGEAWPAWVGEQARIVEMHRNAERLRGWLYFLREEGTKRFKEAGKNADEWEVMWYDSVVYPQGQLAWQDALNEHNISYFQAAHTFFTNYTWARPPQPLPPGQLIDPDDESPQVLQLRGYGLTGPGDGGFHPQLLLTAAMADSVDRRPEDVYVGIDVFGRNCWGGLKAWKSYDMIGPQRKGDDQEALGLSVALFAPGWTWEEENAGLQLESSKASQKRRWSDWWHIDSAFWTGISKQLDPIPHRITLGVNDVKPVQAYFNRSSRSHEGSRRRASDQGFFTNFSFGSGTKWFDGGKPVYDWTESLSASDMEEKTPGFTDMGVCMPKPDLFFAEWQDIQRNQESALSKLETVSWRYDHQRVWSGTASFVISLTAGNGAVPEEGQAVRVPLCSAMIAGKSYLGGHEWRFTVVYDAKEAHEVEPNITLELSRGNKGDRISLDDVSYEDFQDGWRAAKISMQIYRLISDGGPAALRLGFSTRLRPEHASSIRIGALQLCKIPLSSSSPRVASTLEVRPAAHIFDPPSNDEQVLPAALLSWSAPTDGLPSAYFNVWLQQVSAPETRIWLGTSTREATPFNFCLPFHLPLPSHRINESLEYVVTTPHIPSVEICKAPVAHV